MATSTTTAAKDIPPIPDSTDPSLRSPLQRMREEIQRLDGFIGDHMDMAVTWRQLIAQGYATVNQLPPTGGAAPGTVSIPSGSLVYTPDLTPPPDVTGLTAIGGFTDVIVTTDAPTYTQGHGPGSTRIYAAKKDPLDPTMPVFGDASLVYEGFGALSVFAIPSEPNLRWHIWAKWKSADGVESVDPAGGTNGVITTTGQDVTQLLNSLTHAVYDPSAPYTKVGFRADMFYIAPNATFYQDTTPTATAVGQLWFAPSTGITKTWNGSSWAAFDVPLPFVVNTTTVVEDGVSIPPGVYMDAAYIRNLNAMFARFGNAVIDDAMIASLTASKVTAGSLAVGADISSTGFVAGSSGWRIQGNGNAELAAACIRGQLVSSQIAADSITTNHIQVGAVTNSSAGGSGINTTNPAWNVTSVNLGPITGVTHVTVGATVNLWMSVYCHFSSLNPNIYNLDVSLLLYVDGAQIFNGSGGIQYYGPSANTMKVFAYTGDPTGYCQCTLPLVANIPGLAAGTHSFQVLLQVSAHDISGNPVALGVSPNSPVLEVAVYANELENLV
jgi:hypothetical protein